MASTTIETKCSALGCQNRATSRCTGCRDATPPTIYCSPGCQKRDWVFHKKYCGKKAYTFNMTLVGSSNPVITRSFDVPSWYTFQELHYTLQYAMGPWQCTHLHEFSFRGQRNPFTYNDDSKLKILPRYLYEDDFGFSMPGQPVVLKEWEEKLLLSDVFDPRGRLHDKVVQDGEICPLIYTYDFGDCWEHELKYKGEKLAREARPLFTSAQGCGPIEDCGSIPGWEEVKAAFRVPAAQRTSEQRYKVQWAKDVSGLGDACDPFKEPDVVQMNYEGRWENHLQAYKLASARA
ncbi:hypothetical protein CPC08DRAFT_715475 [Agrocybe pediades]|nr:hypothetical protein CPC08DRAFT_715475 [Agrocybe pediades]